MKIMTCKQLGATCNLKMYAQSWDDIVKLMTAHVRERHPDIAKQMEEMHNEDPEKWEREMKPKWDATPEEQAA